MGFDAHQGWAFRAISDCRGMREVDGTLVLSPPSVNPPAPHGYTAVHSYSVSTKTF